MFSSEIFCSVGLFDDWFSTLDCGGGSGGDIYLNTPFQAPFNTEIEFKNFEFQALFNIETEFSNKENINFFRLSKEYIPPKRVTFQGFEE